MRTALILTFAAVAAAVAYASYSPTTEPGEDLRIVKTDFQKFPKDQTRIEPTECAPEDMLTGPYGDFAGCEERG